MQLIAPRPPQRVTHQHFHLRSLWTSPGNPPYPNEDVVQMVGQNGVILLDGCTPMDQDDPYKDCPEGSSAYWIANTFADFIQQRPFADGDVPRQYLKEIGARVSKAYDKLTVRRSPNPWDYPTTTLIYAHISPTCDELTLFWIGDSTCLVKRKDGVIIAYPEPKKPVVEIAVEAGKTMLVSDEANIAKYRAQRESRILNGDLSLSNFPGPMQGLRSVKLKASECAEIFLASDGFDILSNPYDTTLGLFGDKAHAIMFERSQNQTEMDDLGDTLRRQEIAMAEIIKLKRPKIHDDASAARVRIVHPSFR